MIKGILLAGIGIAFLSAGSGAKASEWGCTYDPTLTHASACVHKGKINTSLQIGFEEPGKPASKVVVPPVVTKPPPVVVPPPVVKPPCPPPPPCGHHEHHHGRG